MSPRVEPARFPGAFAYEHTEIPAELTLSAWRRQHAPPRRHRRLQRLLRLNRARRARR